MRRKSPMLLVYGIIMLLPALANAGSKEMPKISNSDVYAEQEFHLPRTEPEKALDNILKRHNSEVEMFFYLTRSQPTVPDNRLYSHLFTPAFRTSVAEAEAKLVHEECGGKYIEGELCGLGVSPITCMQDVSDTYLYRTIQMDRTQAIIAYQWPLSKTAASYRMVRQGNDWKLDGVACIDSGAKFNMR